MILAFDTSDLPGEAITVILLLLFSFIGWLKKTFFDKPVEPPASMEDEEMREVSSPTLRVSKKPGGW